MASRNLKLFLNKQEGKKVFLHTENGEEIVLDDFLLGDVDLGKDIYLNLDNKPLSDMQNQKELLNELLEE